MTDSACTYTAVSDELPSAGYSVAAQYSDQSPMLDLLSDYAALIFPFSCRELACCCHW